MNLAWNSKTACWNSTTGGSGSLAPSSPNCPQVLWFWGLAALAGISVLMSGKKGNRK